MRDGLLGRSAYGGFRSTIKAVGTGPRGSRDLSFEEARSAMADLLDGAVSDAQAGAFLVAMRIKGESQEELAGIAAALRARVLLPAVAEPAGLVCCAGAFDGTVETPHLSLAAGVLAAACGARIVLTCGDPLGPKHGLTPAGVLGALGGPERPSPEESAEMLARARVTLVHAGTALPGWSRLAALRDEIGVRGPVHSAEKLIDWFGAGRFVVGHSHSGFGERLIGALERLAADRAIAVRGLEGSDVLRPGRPSAREGGVTLELPERLGDSLRGEAGAEASAAMTRAVLDGSENGVARYTIALNAGLRLYAAGVAGDAVAGLAMAEGAIADGRAVATLDAMLG